MSDDYEVLIKDATIVDGTGDKPYMGELAINGEKIADVGIELGSAETVIDAKGYIVSPGFIDVHNHGDLSILYYPKADGFLRQGITTFVGGNCGSSPAPQGEYLAGGMFLYDMFNELIPDMYYPSRYIHRDIVNERHRDEFGWEIDWHTMGDFCKTLEKTGISPNFVPILGHNQVRYMVMGEDHKRTASPDEIEAMKPHVRQAMDDGCHGISVGRDYPPSYYAVKEEIIELTKVVTEYNGVYTSHSLRTGLRQARRPGEFPPVKINGILEAIDVGRQTGVSVQISHLGTLYDVTPEGSDIMMEAAAKATLKVIDDAIEEGINVHFDVIPNRSGYGLYSSTWLAGSLLPWLKVTGSREQLAKALKMQTFREEIKKTRWSGKYYGLNPNINPRWASKKVLKHENKDYEGKSIAEIAKMKGIKELDALMDVIMEDPFAKNSGMRFNSPTKYMFYQHPHMMAGTDTLAIDTTWESKSAPWYKPSENSFNGYAAYFQHQVREDKILKIEQAVKQVTSVSAEKFNLKNRGVLRKGAYADIVIMDLDRVEDKHEDLTPNIYPVGIEHVFVNGKHVVKDSEHTGAVPGKVLYRE